MDLAPVLLITFNRPEKTARVIQQIREAKLSILYVSADGPRNEKERVRCMEVRDLVKNSIDWPCEIHYRFLEKNLGCKEAVSSAIGWFFDHEEAGMILEDDCVPSISFFRFCTEMLRLYSANSKVYHIAGSNKQNQQKWGNGSYYFSHFPSIWGWATWKDRWEQYDINLNDFDPKEMTRYNHFLHSSDQQFFYKKTWGDVKVGKVDTWDHQWTHLVFYRRGISIVPNTNLITNIGFDQEATHTTHYEKERADQERYELEFPLRVPNEISISEGADDVIRKYIGQVGQYQRTKQSIKQKIKEAILKLNPPKVIKNLLFKSYPNV